MLALPGPGSSPPLGTPTWDARSPGASIPPSLEGPLRLGCWGEPRDWAGGPRLQAAASDPGRRQETLEDVFASGGSEQLRGACLGVPAPCESSAPKGTRALEKSGGPPATARPVGALGQGGPAPCSTLAAADAWRSGKAGLPGLGCRFSAGLDTALLRGVLSAPAAAVGRTGSGSSRAPPPPTDRQALQAPTRSLLLPPPGFGREGDPRMGVGTAGVRSGQPALELGLAGPGLVSAGTLKLQGILSMQPRLPG